MKTKKLRYLGYNKIARKCKENGRKTRKIFNYNTFSYFLIPLSNGDICTCVFCLTSFYKQKTVSFLIKVKFLIKKSGQV